MAADEWLSEIVVPDGQPVMRVYRWHPWCISLGYHQAEDCVDLNRCGQDRIDVVRRQTGGRAVFHAEEITYSIVLPRDHPLAASVAECYRQLSLGLAAGLRQLGIPVSFQKRTIDFKSHYAKKISDSCFSAAALHEIVVDGHKMVGSAQRRLRNSVLQHGSILTGSSHLNLFLYLKQLSETDRKEMRLWTEMNTVTVGSVLKRDVSHEELARALKAGMEQTFGIGFRERRITDRENRDIMNRERRFSVYRSDA